MITIDGPAASGKSSVSRDVARSLGWSWVSTGIFYRGMAYIALKKSVPLSDIDAVARLPFEKDWQVELTEQMTRFFYNGNDITSDLESNEVGEIASQISQNKKFRQALLEAQRQCAEGVDGLVAEGRDCGSVVFPSALVKIFLTASSVDRAQRRAIQQGVDVEHVQASNERRDARDEKTLKLISHLPEETHVIDTSSMTLEQVVEKVKAIAEGKIK